MKKLSSIAALLVLAINLFVAFPSDAQPANFPDPKVALHGLTAVSIRANSTEDAKKALKSIGVKAGGVESEMAALAKQRLGDIGINVDRDAKDLGAGHAELLLTIYTDLYSGTVKLSASLNELVALVRPPATKLVVTLWQKSGNPRSDESKPIVQKAGDLTEQFIADYLEANRHTRQ